MASQEIQKAIQSYENYITKSGIDESVIDAMIEACKVAYQTEKDIPYALKVSARTKEIIEQFVLKLTGTDVWGLEKYSFENKVKYEIIDSFYEVLLLEAQNKIVDSGFRYLERKREPKERFYMPRRKQFLKIGLVDAMQGMIDDKYDILYVINTWCRENDNRKILECLSNRLVSERFYTFLFTQWRYYTNVL